MGSRSKKFHLFSLFNEVFWPESVLLKRVLSDDGSRDPSIAFEKDFSKVSRQKCNKSLFERMTVEAKKCSCKKI